MTMSSRIIQIGNIFKMAGGIENEENDSEDMGQGDTAL